MKTPRFNYKYKLKGDTKWKDLSENFLMNLIKVFFPDDDILEKIREIKCGHSLEIREATIEAWPKDKEDN